MINIKASAQFPFVPGLCACRFSVTLPLQLWHRASIQSHRCHIQIYTNKVEDLSGSRQTPSDKTVFRTVAVLPFSGNTVDIFSVFQVEGVISVRTVDIADILNAVAFFKTFYRHGIGQCVKLQRSFCRQGNVCFGRLIFAPIPGPRLLYLSFARFRPMPAPSGRSRKARREIRRFRFQRLL